jgi:hypothetical protein
VRPGWYRVVQPDGAAANVADINVGFSARRHLSRVHLVTLEVAGPATDDLIAEDLLDQS